MSWRVRLLDYNRRLSEENPLGLLPAYRLYEPPIYSSLANVFGTSHLYILSAGWGLIEAEFLTPMYDITFSAKADDYKRRRKHDRYADLCRLSMDSRDDLLFLGGRDYVGLFCALTDGYVGTRYIFTRSGAAVAAPGCQTVPYQTARRTNWHYECAQKLIDGRFSDFKPA